MLLSHDTAFADFEPIPEPVAGFSGKTLVETPDGWRSVNSLRAGDRVATVDGGFAQLNAVIAFANAHARAWRVPGGTLGACSDLTLYDGQYLALNGPCCRQLFGLPTVLAPAGALVGFEGIHRATASAQPAYQLRFAEEELVWAQTGVRILAPGAGSASWYQRLDYGQTRALLLLMSGGTLAPDIAA
ncbi:Hint domain-containing protein [Ruegeria marina]|uniref:Hint domain-containing protein n=1 Tax=Ruegeria marina TaxID=639004 RepID=A0A1G6Z7H8_9RHOB|nr:Hint domain-containing protein [Ruegeria marina]SDD98422.1 Hint domain-containing protein [Ruegeria marina]